MKCEIEGCMNETPDKYRFCVVCGKHICWEHVTRLAVTVHGTKGQTWDIPIYLCREHMKERLGDVLIKKYDSIKSTAICSKLIIEGTLDQLGIEYTKQEP